MLFDIIVAFLFPAAHITGVQLREGYGVVVLDLHQFINHWPVSVETLVSLRLVSSPFYALMQPTMDRFRGAVVASARRARTQDAYLMRALQAGVVDATTRSLLRSVDYRFGVEEFVWDSDRDSSDEYDEYHYSPRGLAARTPFPDTDSSDTD